MLQHNSISLETPPTGPWSKAYHSSFCGKRSGGGGVGRSGGDGRVGGGVGVMGEWGRSGCGGGVGEEWV